jgi:Uma2 family endonuclease
MATQVTKTGSALMPYRLTVRQFVKMIQANIFPEGHRVELLGGILSTMVTYDPHDFVVTHLAELLRPRLPGGWTLREEKSVQFGRWWRPNPDISVLKSPSRAFEHRTPRPQDIALLVEVSDTTYRKDSGIKLRRYAHVRVPHYWIVNLERRQVEVYRDPHGHHGKACYRLLEYRLEDDDLPIVIDGHDLGRIAVKEILPS